MWLISKLINKTRTLRVSILILFLSLTVVGFAYIIGFTYYRNYEAIRRSIRAVAGRATDLIVEKFTDIALTAERITQTGTAIFFDLGEISPNNAHLTSYMGNVIKYRPDFVNYYFGLKDGSFLGMFNLKASGQTTLVGEPNKPLPPQVSYALRYVNRSVSPAADTWFFLDDKFQTVVVQTLPTAVFNSLERPWYQGAVKTKDLYWTDFYDFYPLNERGISIADPVFDKNGQVVAVVAADLTLDEITHFLQRQAIGKTGRAFLLGMNGKVLIPNPEEGKESPIPPSLVDEVIQLHATHPDKLDFIFSSHGVRYLAYVSKIPVIFGRDWQIVIIAPLQDFFSEMLKLQKELIYIMVTILILSSFIIAYFAKKISAPIVILANEVNKISKLELESEIRVNSRIREILMIDAAIAKMRRAIRSFACYVPKGVVKDLFQKGEGIHLGGEKKEVTIFFSDVAGFTTIAEAHSIDVLMPLLTEYFDVMTKIIQSTHGTIDKFIGDGIMAFWGAPMDIPDHAMRACSTALQCNAAMLKFNQKRKAEGRPEFRTRFGINTGTVIVGNIGTPDRMNYTVIGDAVNLTARLQEVDKFYHTTMIISENVYKLVKDEFLVRPLDDVNVKGKMEKVKIYELVAHLQGDGDVAATPEQIKLCEAFTEAYDTYMRKDHAKARELFVAILKSYPEDYPTQIYLKRIEEEHS